MRHLARTGRVLTGFLAVVLAAGPGVAGARAARAAAGVPPAASGPVADVSGACPGGSAEVESAAYAPAHAVYDVWMGCGGIGFAASSDGGASFGPPAELPGSGHAWDPAIAVGPGGAVYAAFMVARSRRIYPVVDILRGGRWQVSRLGSPRAGNWGDRDFIAVNRFGTIFVTWDYGPKDDIRFVCSASGSCSFSAGDVNVVIQRSKDGGRTWSPIIPISPGFPASGADSAPIVVAPGGRLDVLYQGYQVLNRATLALGVAHNYFTTSTDNGLKWSRPQRVGGARLWMSTAEWWIDGSLGIDSAGHLYATWDSQSGGRDIGWLAYSTTGGRIWSRPVRVTPDNDQAVHLTQVAGGGPGIAYVGWLTDAPARGYVQYLRVFSARRGWLTSVIRVSPSYGNRHVWPGDTIGLAVSPPPGPGAPGLAVSWGSALGGRHALSQIYARALTGLP